jgi:uncharacterized membrane protein
MFSGPLPPPEILARFNEIITNGADRIMSMAEKQAEHRIAQEALVIRGNVRAQFMGLISAVIITVGTIALGGYLIYVGREIGGLGALIAALASLVGVFRYGRSLQAKERSQKREEFSN